VLTGFECDHGDHLEGNPARAGRGPANYTRRLIEGEADPSGVEAAGARSGRATPESLTALGPPRNLGVRPEPGKARCLCGPAKPASRTVPESRAVAESRAVPGSRTVPVIGDIAA
jgi:hypothetical protein